ncbi:PH domain-containing protein [Microbacterium sp. BWT-B31]|uniref:PH domain-containing protein n=1 Tax=Microbacterium sp. BWT-B31 TaxID=3232072 RepID=UPI0035294361
MTGTARHLISDHGEIIVDEVRKHWAALMGAFLELAGALVLLLLTLFVPPQVWWLPAIAGAAVALHAGWRILDQRLDRFVITNMRVFRIHGILSQSIATMPLARILDISVHKPIIGRVFGYGHFIFESAAQEQGLRAIRFVGDPDQRGLTIQKVIQEAGLRGSIARDTPVPTVVAPAASVGVQAATAPLPPAAGWRVRPYDPDRTPTAPIDLPR